MRSAVVLFPGSNRDRDALNALALISGRQPLVWWHQDPEPPGPVDLVMIPGGFSYGDYLRTGAIAARAPAMTGVRRLAEKGVHVLGVCNGFQILTEAGLLPGALTRNAQLKFICRDLWLKVETADSPFTRAYTPGQVLRVPVAHHDGCYFADEAELDRLEGEGLVAFRYCAGDGAMDPAANANGSRRAIAGVFAPGRRILGMMPHPENAVDPLLGSTDGAGLFQSLVETLS